VGELNKAKPRGKAFAGLCALSEARSRCCSSAKCCRITPRDALKKKRQRGRLASPPESALRLHVGPSVSRGACEERLTRVLLAEDDRTIGKLMKAAFTDGSYRVDWVLDGESARSGFETHTTDMVVLDLGLPKRMGLPFWAKFA
jgi:Response regulator receiver domain